MKDKLISSLALAFALFLTTGAIVVTKISEYPNNGTPVDTNLFVFTQGNTNNNITWLQLKTALSYFDTIYAGNVIVTNEVQVGTFLSLSGNTNNQYTDDGTNLLRNGLPVTSIGGTTNIFETTIITNLYVDQSLTISTNVYITTTNITVNQTSIFNKPVNITTNVYVTNGGSLFVDGTNIAKINPTDNVIPVRLGTNTLGDSPLSVSGPNVTTGGNLLVTTSVGATNYFDLNHPTQTNTVTAALAFSYLTNGVSGAEGTVLRVFLNGSGSDQTVTWPGWSTNMGFALPPAFTNGTATWVLVLVKGDTSSAATQTNAHVISVTYTR